MADPLPNLATPIGQLDEGRLLVAPPVGWRSLGPTRQLIARFGKDFDTLPRIWIRAESLQAYKIDGVTNLDESNVHAFGEQLTAEFKRRGVSLLEPVRAMSVGDRYFVRYVLATKFSRKDRHGTPTVKRTERQVLMTVAAGRIYTVDLHVSPNTIPAHRDMGYSVLAGLKFLSPEPKSAAVKTDSKSLQPPVPNRNKTG